jgi:hypothetical protein
MDTALNENKSELTVLVFPIALQMLPDLHRLFDEHVQVFWNFRRQSIRLEDAHEFLARDGLDLGDTILITQNDPNLTGHETLLGEFADVLFHIRGCHLEPRGWTAFVREGPSGNALAGSVHATHGSVMYVCINVCQ